MLIVLFQIVCCILQSTLLFTYLHPLDVFGGSFLYTMYCMSIVHILLLYVDHNNPYFFLTIVCSHCINIGTICILFFIAHFNTSINTWCIIVLKISIIQVLPFYINYYSKMV
jgi:hypothetical protein